jgi:hypothetical protein
MANNANTVPAIQYISNTDTISLSPGSTNYLGNDPFLNILSPNKSLAFPNYSTITASPREVDFSANTLGTTKHTYTSPNQSDMVDLAAYFADFGFHYHISEGPVYIMTVDVAWDDITNEDYTIAEFASEQWEIVPVAGSKSLVYSGLLPNPFLSPTAAGNYQVMPLTLQSAVQRANKTGGNYLNITSSLTPIQQAQYAPFVSTANTVLQYLKLGIEGIPQYTQQLKRTAVIDVHNTQRAFQTEADVFRSELNAQGTINYMLSAADMLSSYAIPPNTVGQFMMPSYSKQLGVPNLDPIIYNVYAGYLVQPPTISFIGLNKVQITQIFVWDEWAQGMFYISSPQSDFPLVYSTTT